MENNTDFSEKISKMLQHIGVNRNDFAKSLGYNRTQSIYDISKGKSNPSFDFFYKLFHSEYSEVFNPIWLFTGKGEMLKSKQYNLPNTETLNINEPRTEYLSFKIPLISSEEAKNYLENYKNPNYIEALPKYVLPISKKGNYRLFEVPYYEREQLENKYKNYAVGELITNWEKEIRDDHKYVIISEEKGIIISKVLNRIDSHNLLFCKEDTKKGVSPDVLKEEIIEVWKVVMTLSTEPIYISE